VIEKPEEKKNGKTGFPWWILFVLIFCFALILVLRCTVKAPPEIAHSPRSERSESASPRAPRSPRLKAPDDSSPALVEPREDEEDAVFEDEKQDDEFMEEEDDYESEIPAPAAAPASAPAQASSSSSAAPEAAPAPAAVPVPILTPSPLESPVESPRRGVQLFFDHTPYDFDYRPVGIIFCPDKPIRIESFAFNSYAKTFGLTEEQRLTRIKEFDIKGNHDHSHVESVLADAMKDLPYWPLKIVFRTPIGGIEEIEFVQKPLGMLFTEKMPFTVRKFRPYSLAQRMGVQAGWEIVRIADEDTTQAGMASIGITGKAGFNHLDYCLQAGTSHLPTWTVPIEFKTPSGEKVTIEFSEKPLGMSFTKHLPPKVEKLKPGCIAEEMGVEIGWDIMQIGEVHQRRVIDFKHFSKALDEHLLHLPARQK